MKALSLSHSTAKKKKNPEQNKTKKHISGLGI
jgi:hypothetical protein